MRSKVASPNSKTLAIIMGGGAGTRLYPLTQERAKPAVPIGGKYRLVDIPISNCLNSGIRSIYVLTQFNSVSLHRHINNSYKFDPFHPSFVEVLAAQQTPEGSEWYQGTADAVRQNLKTFLNTHYDYFIILSGDQLYRMDYRNILQQHIKKKANLTIACIPVNRTSAPSFGIMETEENLVIKNFIEKPTDPNLLESLRIQPSLLSELKEAPDQDLYLASMGIYLFNREHLIDCLDNNFTDFGRDIIPEAIKKHHVQAAIFRGYWEDIGTIRSFFNANLSLVDPTPDYTFYEPGCPVYTESRFLPASVIENTMIKRAIISDGCRIESAKVERCVIGIRSIIGAGSTLSNSIMMGADYYESEYHHHQITPQTKKQLSETIGIGKNCHITHAIIDKNARIGNNVTIRSQEGKDNYEGNGFSIRDGIVIIHRNATIPEGTQI